MDKIEQIKNILMQHRGKSNAITSREIAVIVGINYEDDTHAKTRVMILEAAKKYKLPLAAYGDGYYLVETEEEFNEYMENLDSRIEGIEERKKLITENYNLRKEQNEDL